MSDSLCQGLFQSRTAVLATMHQKEQVIAPILKHELGLQVFVPLNFDTDAFGTFTREVKRSGNQLEAARLKAQKALEATGATIAIASEGAFGPHPSIPWISSNREIILFIDQEQGLEIVGEEFSLRTNYSYKTVSNVQEGLEFADQVGFPEHGLIVMDNDCSSRHQIFKGITSESELHKIIIEVTERSPDKKAHLETDMRAMYNPTRMKNIEKATINLVNNIKRFCPVCSAPGFRVSEAKKGLICAFCGLPTVLTKALIYRCSKCNFTQEQLFPDGMEYADPSQCLYCNP